MTVTIEPIKPLIGGAVRIDRARLLDDDVVQTILEALEERGVLVFPEINASDEEQVALTDKLGGQVTFKNRIPGADASGKGIYKITLDKEINNEPDYVLGTFFWHVDGVTANVPVPKGTVLSARQLSDSGGSTEFANLYAAYDKLSDQEKADLEDLKVIHTVEASVRPVYGQASQERIERWRQMAPPMEQPLVWTHPDGRKSLLLGTHADAIVGWPQPHGRAMLWRLQQWAAQPDFVYRHSWKVGDLVIWNNHGLMHRVVPYTDTGRSMHRTSLAGAQQPGRAIDPEAFEQILERSN